jgi:hypothetical protein
MPTSRLALNSLYFVGLLLLIFAFFFLLSPPHRTDLAWLDLVVACLVFTTIYLFLLSTTIRSFHLSAPILASLLWVTPIYVLAALGVLRYGWMNPLGFRLQLVLQMFFLFAYLVVVTAGWRGNQHATQVEQFEADQRGSVRSLQSAITDCELALVLAGDGAEPVRRRLMKLKEDARYLSRTSDSRLLELERDIIDDMQQLKQILANKSVAAEQSNSSSVLAKAEAALQQRINAATR